MYSKKQLLAYATYNLWANERMIQLFRARPELISQPVVSSFPSVRETFLHLYSVEIVWHSRLKGENPTQFMADTFKGCNEELFENLLQSSQQLIDFVKQQPARFFQTPITFRTLANDGNLSNLPSDILHHCFNHQHMHRGQLITMARQLGITKIESIDYLIWVRQVKK